MVNDGIRAHKDFKMFLMNIKYRFIQQGLKPPSIKKITEIIAKQIKEEDILYDKSFRFR